MNITRRTATVVIYQGDDLARLGELRQAADLAQRLFDDAAAAAKSGTGRVGDSAPDPKPARDAYDSFIDEAAERAVEVRLSAIGRKHWRDLVEAHPPREVDGENGKVIHEDDEGFGVNTRTFPEQLLAFTVDGVRTIAEPEFDTPSERQAWLDDISEGDFDRLWATAYYLNTSLGVDPKGSRFSAAPMSSDGTIE